MGEFAMTGWKKRAWAAIWPATGVACLMLLAGCYGDWWGTYKDPGTMPEPNGAFVQKFQHVQTAKARETELVIFLDEWYMGGTTLGPAGSRHLDGLVQRLRETPAIVKIQPHFDPELNEQRRLCVINSLLKHGIPDPAKWVIVGFPSAEDFNGDEAERTYWRMLHSRNDLYGGYGMGGYGGFGMGGYGGYGMGGYGGGVGMGGYGGYQGGYFGRSSYLP
jgi:hypothetical protein